LIGTCSSYLGVEALKLAVREAKKGKDVKRYLEAQSHLETVGPQEREATRDKAWMDMTEKQNQAETQRLEAELKGYKNNLIKESIRVCLQVGLGACFEMLITNRWVMRIWAITTKLSVTSQEHSTHSAV
jgi:hypothetical protein